MNKTADAFRTISEVAEDLDLPQHVLRFWETRFPQIKPLKRAGGRRFYRPSDVQLLATIQKLLYGEGYTIKGVQRLLKEQGVRGVQVGSRAVNGAPPFQEDERHAVWPPEATHDELIAGEETVPGAASPAQVADTMDHQALHRSASPDHDGLLAALRLIVDCQQILDSARRPLS